VLDRLRHQVSDWAQAWDRRTRPTDPRFTAALARRWAELPEVARTAGQVLGRFGVGCEGTHGVFPACDLKCTPCYPSRDANQVRVDGGHTCTQVQAQMSVLEQLRGPRAHAQLIGGEVTLLPPDDHAAALQIMRDRGREPMSMTHGDVDYAYLQQLVLGPGGRRRLDRVSFAGHFDKMMFGRRGIPRPPDEASLHPYRRRFVALFTRLRREHGARSFLAPNMTVTPANVGEVAEVATMGFGMLSLQPAAYVGDDRRWREDYRTTDVSPDAVWAQIERGAGTALDCRVFENGDVRCNRTAYGFYLGARWYPVLDGADPRDLATRDDVFRYLSGIGFRATPAPLLAAKLARLLARHPRVLAVTASWAVRTVRRVGARALLRAVLSRSGPRPVTFVMHQFMDAADVAPAWELMQQGISSDDPRLRETQERLAACHYAMGHPENGNLVPACVQHSVLDPAENVQLRTLLPLVEVRRSIRRNPGRSSGEGPRPGATGSAGPRGRGTGRGRGVGPAGDRRGHRRSGRGPHRRLVRRDGGAGGARPHRRRLSVDGLCAEQSAARGGGGRAGAGHRAARCSCGRDTG